MTVKEVTQQVEKDPTIEDLFTPIETAQKRAGIRAVLWGDFGSGKSYTALSFPGPIHVIDTEHGVAPLAHLFPGKDIKIMNCSVPFGNKPKNISSGEEIDDPFLVDPVLSLKKVEQATLALSTKVGGTIVVDSVSDIWEWLGSWLQYNTAKKVSAKGKEYMMQTEWAHANSMYRVLIDRLLNRPCNVVLTSRSSAVYQDGQVTTSTKMKTQQSTPYWMDLVIKMAKMPMPIGTTGKFETKRVATIEKCRFGDPASPIVTDLTYDKLKEALKGAVPEGIFQ